MTTSSHRKRPTHRKHLGIGFSCRELRTVAFSRQISNVRAAGQLGREETNDHLEIFGERSLSWPTAADHVGVDPTKSVRTISSSALIGCESAERS
jgi:hypothetical protein